MKKREQNLSRCEQVRIIESLQKILEAVVNVSGRWPSNYDYKL